MNKGKTDQNAATKGFAELLIQASCATRIPGFGYASLSTHPFFRTMPTGRGREVPFGQVEYLSRGGTHESVDSITRLVAWELTIGRRF